MDKNGYYTQLGLYSVCGPPMMLEAMNVICFCQHSSVCLKDLELVDKEKIRSLMVMCFDRETCNNAVDAERNQLRELISATRCHPSARYGGTVSLQ
jgi:hypothetical protein